MQIRQSMYLINLQGWPKPAGWNSGTPFGSVVLIYAAIALQWFIYLIGMNSKSLIFSLVFPFFCSLCLTPINTHILCWMSWLSSPKRTKKPTCQYSKVRSGLTFEVLIVPILYRLLDKSVRQADIHLLPFIPFLFSLNPFRVMVARAFLARTVRETVSHVILIPSWTWHPFYL